MEVTRSLITHLVHEYLDKPDTIVYLVRDKSSRP